MTTTYTTDLGEGRQIYLENQGIQTLVTLNSATPGQQQSQQTGFTTGQWIAPPTLFQSPLGIIVHLDTEQGEIYLQVQANGMQLLQHTPDLNDATVLTVQPVTSDLPSMAPMQPIQPMQPMQPMKMGNMEMKMNPMQMRMGDMELRMGEKTAEASPAPAPTTSQRFCTQCGRAVAIGDRFCAQCGNPLQTG